MASVHFTSGRREDPYIQDTHRIAVCASAPERLWSQNHNGVFRSKDPDTAWLVSAIEVERRVPADAKVVVAHTRDGGDRWAPVSHHLPPVYSVRFGA